MASHASRCKPKDVIIGNVASYPCHRKIAAELPRDLPLPPLQGAPITGEENIAGIEGQSHEWCGMGRADKGSI